MSGWRMRRLVVRVAIDDRTFRLYPQRRNGLWECLVSENDGPVRDDALSTDDDSETDTLASGAEYLMRHVLDPDGDSQ